jgi:hypothetical protein
MSWVAELICLAGTVPSAFWGIIAGSFFSLGGVALTNRANDRRLRAQLAHDRELRISDREAALRKDIYLAVSEALFAGLISVGRFANLEIPNDKIVDGYAEKAPAVAKVHIIANEPTLKAVIAITNELGATFMQLIAKRVPLMVLKNQLAQLDQGLARISKDTDGTLELMKKYNLDGARDPGRWTVIQARYEFEQKQLTERQKERANFFLEFYAKQLQFMEECFKETTKLGQLLVPAVLAVRKELGLPIDEVAYATIMRQTQERQIASLAQFSEQARTFIAQPGA